MSGLRLKQMLMVCLLAFILVLLSGTVTLQAAEDQKRGPTPPQGTRQTNAKTSDKPEKTVLDVGASVIASAFLPLYVALDEGFYKSEGLEVTLTQLKGGSNNIRALVGGSLDFSVGSATEPLDAIMLGQDVIAFLSHSNNSSLEWWGQPELKSALDAKGKRWGITQYGALFDLITREIIKRNGLDPEKDVQILQVGATVEQWAALKARVIDVALLGPPGTYRAREAGYNLLASQFKDLAEEWPQEVYYAKKEFLQKCPNTVKAIARVHAKAIKFIAQNRDRAAEISSKRLGFSLEDSKRQIEDMIKYFPPDGHYADKGTDVVFDIYKKSGLWKKDVTKEQLYDSSMVKYLQSLNIK